MIYMVEMGFSALGLREKWDEWYLSHMKMLITIPGIRATQRFEALHDHIQPFVAMHDVTGPDVFTSDAYKTTAGPASTGEWRTLHTHWVRNVYDGMDQTPDVSMNAFLMIAESGAERHFPPDITQHVLRSVGLDREPPRRVLAVTDQPSLAARAMDQPGIRVLKPLTPRLVAERA
ncbi:MAG: hypothetical protein EXR05_05685 [Acetobacteraceae bacterium]|nr:hypothetical protein [Acetobacteraceae bacterium]